MTSDITCISCRLMFRVRLKEGETSHSGKCPKCGRKYKVEK